MSAVGRDLAQQAAKDAVKNAIKDSLSVAIKENVSRAVNEEISKSISQGIKNATGDAIRNSIRDSVAANVKAAVKDSISTTIRESSAYKDAAAAGFKDTFDDSMKTALKDQESAISDAARKQLDDLSNQTLKFRNDALSNTEVASSYSKLINDVPLSSMSNDILVKSVQEQTTALKDFMKNLNKDTSKTLFEKAKSILIGFGKMAIWLGIPALMLALAIKKNKHDDGTILTITKIEKQSNNIFFSYREDYTSWCKGYRVELQNNISNVVPNTEFVTGATYPATGVQDSNKTTLKKVTVSPTATIVSIPTDISGGVYGTLKVNADFGDSVLCTINDAAEFIGDAAGAAAGAASDILNSILKGLGIDLSKIGPAIKTGLIIAAVVFGLIIFIQIVSLFKR